MTPLDWILAALIGFGAWRGSRTGAVKQIVGTAGLVIAFVVGTTLMKPVGAMVASGLGVSPRTGPVLGFIVTFSAVLAAASLVGYILREALESLHLSSLDRLGGLLAGGLRAAFGLSVALLVTGFVPTPGQGPVIVDAETRQDSVLYEPVEALAPEAWDLLQAVTPGFQEAVRDKFNSWQDEEALPDSLGLTPAEGAKADSSSASAPADSSGAAQ